MTTLDLKKPYGVLYGHDHAKYEQNGRLYDSQYRLIMVPVAEKKTSAVVGPDPLSNAKAFLLQVLKENPLSKSIVYKEVENNNYSWEDVKNAALELGIVKFTQKNLEMWKLPEGVSA